LQELPLAAITPRLVEKWRTARLERGTKPATVNRELADLRSCLSKAVVWGLLEQHPLAGIKPLRTDNQGPVRFLSREEESALRQALEAREVELRRGRASANA
jgi:site-specific recombinase XerD